MTIEVDDSLPLKWTKEKPTKPGYYWRRLNIGDAQVHRVFDVPDKGMFVDLGRAVPTPVDSLFIDGEWAGPIPRPE